MGMIKAGRVEMVGGEKIAEHVTTLFRKVNCMRKLILTAVLLVTMPAFAAPASRPVIVTKDDPKWPACGTSASVRLPHNGFLSVRDGPSEANKELFRIYRGQNVIICDGIDQKPDGNGGVITASGWYSILFPPVGNNAIDCEPARPDGQVYKGPCKAGWVSGTFLTDFAD